MLFFIVLEKEVLRQLSSFFRNRFSGGARVVLAPSGSDAAALSSGPTPMIGEMRVILAPWRDALFTTST